MNSQDKSPLIILMNVCLLFLPDLSITVSCEECVYCEQRLDLRGGRGVVFRIINAVEVISGFPKQYR